MNIAHIISLDYVQRQTYSGFWVLIAFGSARLSLRCLNSKSKVIQLLSQ